MEPRDHHTPSPAMDSFQESQSDIEVILDFLEECYMQSPSADSAPWWPGGLEDYCTWMSATSLADAAPTPIPDADTLSGHGPAAGLAATTPLSCVQKARTRARRSAPAAGAGGKLRLYRFLFEVLQDPGMAHCVSWEPAGAAGVFRFSSANKEAVAALWGQRKGNRRPMTYQKMARALRNYGRSGEIVKVKRKLTYRFSTDTLRSLQGPQRPAGGALGPCNTSLCTPGSAPPSG